MMSNSLLKNQSNTLLALTGALILAACSTPAGDAASGQRWYDMNHCSGCHGKNANDGKAMAIRNLDMSFSRFEHVLRNPYSPSMPAFSEQKVSKQDAADIYAWLKSLE